MLILPRTLVDSFGRPLRTRRGRIALPRRRHMLAVNELNGFGAEGGIVGAGSNSFYEDLVALGLAKGLKLCFDAGSFGSWPGNYLGRSQEIDLTPWNVSNTTVTANAVAAPDGTTTAEKIVETAVTGQHIVYQNVTFAANTRYCFSIHVKAAERRQFYVLINGTGWGASTYSALFDSLNMNVWFPDTAPETYGIIPLANGWARIWMSQTTDGVGGASNFQPGLAKNEARSYAGTLTEGGYMWGAQVDVGSTIPRRYVPTTAAAQQKLVDLSGGEYDFFRGADGASATDDPTFNGTAGALSSSEYFTFDAADIFRYDATNEAFMQNWHKDSAKFTLACWLYNVAAAGNNGLCGDTGTGAGTGIRWNIDVGKQRFMVNDGTVMDATAGTAVGTGAWKMLAVSIDEAAAAGGFFYKNGAYDQVGGADTFNPTYNGPGTGNASQTLEIGAVGAAGYPMQNTARLAGFFAWEGMALTKADLDSIWNQQRSRFGL